MQTPKTNAIKITKIIANYLVSRPSEGSLNYFYVYLLLITIDYSDKILNNLQRFIII